MYAVVLQSRGGQVIPELTTVSRPVLEAGTVRVSVRAASINRADLLIREGTHAPAASNSDAPAVAGLDACGEVIEVAPDVTAFAVGDRVMAMVPGGLAEEVVIPVPAAVPVPDAWSYVEGAAAIVGLMTEHNALVTAGRLRTGESVLVHAAASGVATQAIQLARVLGAGTIFGTSRSHTDSPVLCDLGIDELIDPTAADFADRVLDATEGRGVDVILDHVGGPYLEGNLRAAAITGRIVGVGRLGGAIGQLDMEELARKRVELIGVTFRTRSAEEKFAITAALRSGVDLNAHADALRPLIHATHPWENTLEAQQSLAENRHVGKIVLDVGQP